MNQRLLSAAREEYNKNGVLHVAVEGTKYVTRECKRRTIEPVLFDLHNRGYLDLDDLYSEDYYNRMDRDEAMKDAENFCSLLISRYEPTSVIDLGCGVGRFLKPFYDEGVAINGVDAVSHAIDQAIVPTDRLEQHDLREPYHPEEKRDLVLCIEVLEHLPADAADTVVESISRCASVAVITAAPPGQSGTYHVNEQPPEYWINKFDQVGMVFDQEATQWITTNIQATELNWLNHNCMVFVEN